MVHRKLFASVLMVAVMSLVLVNPAAAQNQSYKVDPNHNGVVFSIGHMGLAKVFGHFTQFTGSIAYDAAKPEQASFDLQVEAASINTANEKRDEHLRTKDFFNVEKFPLITFKSTSVKAGDDKGELEVTGDLTLMGVTKSVTIEMDAKGPNEKGAVGFTTELKIKRSDFGMGYGIPMIGDEVKLDISFEAIQP